MRITVFEAEQWERDALHPLDAVHFVRFLNDPLREPVLEEFTDSDIVSVFIYSQLRRPVLERFPRLRMIATRSAGYDHIDLDYCRERGILVANVPTYGDNTVAEHVFALLLGISHHMVEAVDRTRRGDFSLRGLRGFDLMGKTLGVIGTGGIGRHVIRIAKGFAMNVIAYDTRPNEQAARELGFSYVPLDRLLAESDVITLHVPGGKATEGLIGDREFNLMKRGAVLINTARGSVVDVNALIRALAEGKVAAAGLDVLPEEPVIREEAELLRSMFTRQHAMDQILAGHVLLRLRNVIITPHSAFNTNEAVGRILTTTLENIEAFVRGQPQNVVA
ncbi:MAG: hydroxyacid dehydrogenase [bacterium]